MRFVLNRQNCTFAAAGLLVGILYSAHLVYCQHSALQYFDFLFRASDMHTNLLWANGIREQGWLDPTPYHPWVNWMQPIAPYPQWVKWWGGANIFQQSPLYAYLLSLFLPNLLVMRVVQAIWSIGTCIFLGLFAGRISGNLGGWIAFWLAALYAPFYAYSWPFLRDGLGLFITAVLLWALAELTHSQWPSRRASGFGYLVGVLLGLGFLAKETYLLLIPVVLVTLASFAWKRRSGNVVARVGLATILTISPLVIRNLTVKAPLLSTSNRFAEAFITGNANTSDPYRFVIPSETGRILFETQARPLPVIMATISSHPDGVRGWLRLQFLKLLALFDPYESPDNLSIYFVENISPIVRFGLRYWMVLPLALGGLFLTAWRREKVHLWTWIFLPITLASILVGPPVSRYRQSLLLLFIPWAAYLLAYLFALVRHREFRKVAYSSLALLIAWVLILGPLARQPRSQYERPVEYLMSAEIYHSLGNESQAQAMLVLVRRKFPGALP
jgi:4-amino-4-deoxy-L-arabinose transferase-like glycosyltransferase